MLIKNKSNRNITVTDKDNAQVNMHPGMIVEVEDTEWKGYLSNYSDIVEKVESWTPEQLPVDELTSMKKRLSTMEKALNDAGIPLPQEEVPVDEWTDETSPLTTLSFEWKIARLREKCVKNVGRNRTEAKLDKKMEELLADEEEKVVEEEATAEQTTEEEAPAETPSEETTPTDTPDEETPSEETTPSEEEETPTETPSE